MDIHQVTSSAVSHASEIPPGSSDPLVVYGIAGTGSLIAGRSPSLKKGEVARTAVEADLIAVRKAPIKPPFPKLLIPYMAKR